MTTADGSGRRSLGWIATVVIGYLILANAWGIYRVGDEIHDLVSHSAPEWQKGLYWVLPVLMGLAAFNIACLGLLLARRQIGLTLFLLATAAGVAFSLYLSVPLTTILLGLIGPVILWMVVHARWNPEI